MRKKWLIPILLLLFLSGLIFFVSSSGETKTGETMTGPKVTRLGTVNSGVIARKGEKEEVNDPNPLVLWSGALQPNVFYYSYKTDTANRVFNEKISDLSVKRQGWREKIDSWFDDYPITYNSGSDDLYDNSINTRNTLTADINGDGQDELILSRVQGGVYVFSTKKLLFKHAPSEVKPDLYSFEFLDPYKVALPGRDVAFLTINRSFIKHIEDLTPDELAFYKRTENYSLLKIDKSGISPIFLKSMGWKIGKIVAISAMNRAGSDGIDELIIWSTREDKTPGIFVSRHRLDGSIIESPRKMYVEVFDSSSIAGRFIPQSNVVVFVGAGTDSWVYFIYPEKPANWLRAVDLKKAIPGYAINFMGITRHDNLMLAIARNENDFYALDQEGKFYSWKDGALKRSSEKATYFSLKPESDRHKLIRVFEPDKSNDNYLAVWSQEPGPKALPDEELIAAGKKFLKDDDYADAAKELTVKFEGAAVMEANDIARNKGLNQDIKSIDDVKKYLPEFYIKLQKSARKNYINFLITSLFWPITKEGYKTEENDYKNMKEYLTWLKNSYNDGEVLFISINDTGSIVGKTKITGFFHPDLANNYRLKYYPVVYRGQGNKGTAVMTLKKKTLEIEEAPGYYMIEW